MKYNASANIKHLIQSTNSHILAWGLTVLSYSLFLEPLKLQPVSVYMPFIQGFFAFLLSSFFKLPLTWRWLNLILFPASFTYMFTGLSSIFLFLAFMTCFLLFIPALWSRIPYYPTSSETYAHVSELLSKDKEIKFIDLGCGFSGLLMYLSKKHPEIQFYGNEIGPLPYIISKLKSLCRKNLKISFKSFWKENFADYDFVYCFLAPPPMEDLWKKVKSEMKQGSVFVSNTFEVPAKPNQIIELSDERQNRLLIFRN